MAGLGTSPSRRMRTNTNRNQAPKYFSVATIALQKKTNKAEQESIARGTYNNNNEVLQEEIEHWTRSVHARELRGPTT